MDATFLFADICVLPLLKQGKRRRASSSFHIYISVRQIRFEIFYYSGRIKQNLTSRLKALHSLQTCYQQILWSNGQIPLTGTSSDDGMVKTAFTKNAWCVSEVETHQNNS